MHFFICISFFDENPVKPNRIAPDGTKCFAASHLGLFCLPMPHKRTPGLYGLNDCDCLTVLRLKVPVNNFQSCRDGATASCVWDLIGVTSTFGEYSALLKYTTRRR